jgi:hypothetical protein
VGPPNRARRAGGKGGKGRTESKRPSVYRVTFFSAKSIRKMGAFPFLRRLFSVSMIPDS